MYAYLAHLHSESFLIRSPMFLIVFAVIIAVSHANDCGISKPVEEQKTEGIAPLEKWPWQVYVRTPDSFCGGTIIADRWILTAAHCFDDQLNGTKFEHNPLIRTGVVNIEEAAKDDFQHKNVYDVKEVYVHAEYSIESMNDDIALLELKRSINYTSTVAPICLAHADQDVNIDQQGWIIGFGTYIDDETKKLVDDVSNVLREAKIPLARHSNCQTEWDNVDKVICAGSHGIGAGEGDSGGPLMLQSVDGPWYQVGVVSFGKDDEVIAANHTIGGYTSVGHYCDWIEKVTGGEAKCAENEVEMMLVKEEEREVDSTTTPEKDEDGDEEDNKEDGDEDEKGKEEEKEDETTPTTVEDDDDKKDSEDNKEEEESETTTKSDGEPGGDQEGDSDDDDDGEDKEEGDDDNDEHEITFSLYNILSNAFRS